MSGLRQMEPTRDLVQVADLIEESFAEEIGSAGLAAVHDLRLMARLSPLVWLLDRTALEFRDSFGGFVWVEDGRVVGNITLSRSSPTSTRWHISNVAVKDHLRGRGIGRHLVEAGVDFIRARGGEWAILQVRHDNEPALRIYRSLGFEDLFLTSEMCRDAVAERATPPPAQHGYTFRPCQRSDWRREYNLALTATPLLERWVRGMEGAHIRRSGFSQLWERVSNWLAGTQTANFCLEPPAGEELAGRISVCSRCAGGDNQLILRVDPRHRSLVERMLVGHAIEWLQRKPGLRTVSEHATEHTEGIEALQEYGFRERRRLLTMRRAL